MQFNRLSKIAMSALLSSMVLFSAVGTGATTVAAPLGAKPKPTRTPVPTSPPQPTAIPTPLSGPVCWNVVAAPNIPGDGTVLNSVHGTGPNDVWAVGYFTTNGTRHTLTLHWNGANWSVAPSPDALPAGNNVINVLSGVTAIAPNDVWAVGYSVSGTQSYATLTMHWNGAAWQIVPSPNLPITRSDIYNALDSVSAVSANDVWAVGGAPNDGQVDSRAVLMHWNGAAWSLTPEPPETALWSSTGRTGVTAVAANDVWAVGQFSAFRWNGSAWAVPAGFSGQRLLSVDHGSASNVWSVGSVPPSFGEGGSSTYSGVTNRFDGTAWSSVIPVLSPTGFGFKGVTVVSPTNVWAVGFQNQSTHTQQWDGTAWHVVGSANGNPNPNPNLSFSNQLLSVHANSATDIWAVGFYWDNALTSQIALIERYVCQ